MKGQNLGYKHIANVLGRQRDTVRDFCRRNNLAPSSKKGKDIKQRVCVLCGVAYIQGHSTIYCTTDCRDKAKKARQEASSRQHTYSCAICGQDFTRLGKQADLKYCGAECKKDGARLRAQAYKERVTPWRFEQRECLYCKGTFVPNIEEQKYCSRHCAGKGTGQRSHADFARQIKDKYEGSIVALDNMESAYVEVKLLCKFCDHVWLEQPDRVLSSKRAGCPKCSKVQSSGATAIEEWLIKNGIEYRREHTFKGCKSKTVLPFDFAVMDGGECIALIEFNGLQHYEPIPMYGGRKQLLKQQRHDAIKANFCLSKGLPLITIRYDEEQEIQSILAGCIQRRVTARSRDVVVPPVFRRHT